MVSAAASVLSVVSVVVSAAAVSAEVELPHATRPIPMVIAITRARIFFIIFPPFPCPYVTDTD